MGRSLQILASLTSLLPASDNHHENVMCHPSSLPSSEEGERGERREGRKERREEGEERKERKKEGEAMPMPFCTTSHALKHFRREGNNPGSGRRRRWRRRGRRKGGEREGGRSDKMQCLLFRRRRGEKEILMIVICLCNL